MSARTRRRFAIAYFAASTVVLIAPVQPWLGNSIEPRILGLPWSLVYVLLVIAVNFGVLSWLYLRDPDGDDDV